METDWNRAKPFKKIVFYNLFCSSLVTVKLIQYLLVIDWSSM